MPASGNPTTSSSTRPTIAARRSAVVAGPAIRTTSSNRVPAGPRVGELLREASDRQMEGGFADRAAALAWLKERVAAG